MTKKATSSIPLGNRFEYYAPKPSSGGAPATTPKDKSSAFATKTKGGAIAKPAKAIKRSYPKTAMVPFGVGGALSGDVVVRDLELAQAAIECGYGKRGLWSSELAMSRRRRSELQHHLLLRHEFVASCIDVDRYAARVLRSFVGELEKSELAAMSFIVGQYGAFLVAKRWLAAAGQKMGGFLHYDIYSRASITAPGSVTNESRPDFLVATQSGDWHLFESKGGSARERWANLAKGLRQLDNVAKVGWTGVAPVEPTSRVCVHTTFEVGEPIRVTAVDPPGRTASEPSDSRELRIVKSVCQCLVALDTIDQYRALVGRPATAPDVYGADWQGGQTQRFGGMSLAVPRRLLAMERRLRRALFVYLGVREVALALTVEGSRLPLQPLLDVMARNERLVAAYRGSLANAQESFDVRRQISAALASNLGFLPGLSGQVGLERLGKEVDDVRMAALEIQNSRKEEWLATSGGMLLIDTGVRA